MNVELNAEQRLELALRYLREGKAWALHVRGFHEAKFDSEDKKERLPALEKTVVEAQEIVGER